MTGDQAGGTNMFSGLHSTCEDLARFGSCSCTTGSGTAPRWCRPTGSPRRRGSRPRRINAAYGYLWWINAEGAVLGDPLKATSAADAAKTPPSRLVPGAPVDMYWALGLGGQVVQVDPGSDTVVVRLGPASLTGGSGRTGPGNSGSYGPAQTAKVVTDALVDPAAGTLPG